MKKALDTLIAVIPSLSSYPAWVKGIVGFWILFTAIVLIILLFTRPQEKRAEHPVAKSHVQVKDSPGAIVQNTVDSPGAIQVAGDLINNSSSQIQLPLKFETSIGNLFTTNRKLFDVLYILPNNKAAFISAIERGKKYVLFYANEDRSEIHVPEKYRSNSNMANEACWIVTLVPIENGYRHHLELGPKSQRVDPMLVYED